MRYLVALMLGLAAPVAAQAADVRVELTGVRAGGTLYVQLQNRGQFMGNDRVAGQRVAAPAAGSVSVDLGEVPPGEYAVSVWHDDNGNQRFDVDPASGRVLDGVAMVNADALRGPPTFDQIKVTVPEGGLIVPLTLRYGR